MDHVNHMSVDDMKIAIAAKYGPTIHNKFIYDMPAGQVARIYIQMMKLGPSDPERKKKKATKEELKKEALKVVPIKRKKKPYFVEGQMSLFD